MLLLRGQKEVVNFLQTPEIINELAAVYLNPMAEMMNSSLHTGWYRTAKTHRFLGFDVSLNMSVSSTPSDRRGYHLTKIEGFDKYYTVTDGSFSIAANVAGLTNDFPSIKSKDNGREIQLPKGEGEDRVSLSVLSAGIGLPYNTEIRIKLMPKIDKGGMGHVVQYGVGIKHSIKEYIPVLEDIPTLSLAAFGAYSVINNEILFDYPSAITSSQMLDGSVSGFTGKIVAGIDVPVLSAYLGFGYGSSSVEYSLKGNYYVGDVLAETEQKDPLLVGYDYAQVQVDFGIKAKLGIIEIFAGYNPGEYGTFSFGAGVNIK